MSDDVNVTIDPEGLAMEALAVPNEAGSTATLPTGTEFAKTLMVGNYRVSDAGVYWIDPNPDTNKPRSDVFVCSRLDVAACTRNADGEDWGRLLSFKDSDGRQKEWAMPMALLAGDGAPVREHLLSLGLTIGSGAVAKKYMLDYLQAAKPKARARSVPRIGWHDGAFILPDGAIGAGDGDRVLLQRSDGADHAFRVAGTLEEWKYEIARLAVGNSRLIFALSFALAPPLMPIVGEESGGVHFRGDSSTGKTTALRAAASVWGGKSGDYMRRWRATANGVEAAAALHNHALLILDELGQASPDEVGDVVYMLANESGKVRANRNALARRTGKWQLLFLSSGEVGLSTHMGSGRTKRASRGGQEVRLADLAMDAGKGMGGWEDLHGYPSAKAFSDALRNAADRYYGTPIRAFLAELAKHDTEEVRAGVHAFRAIFLATYAPLDASGEVLRVASRFALVAAAGEMAARAGILPWEEGEALAGCGTCFQSLLASRGSAGPSDMANAVAQVRAFIEAHGASRFADLDAIMRANGTAPGSGFYESSPTEPKIIDRVGFKRRSGDDGMEFLVLGEAFRREVCEGYDPAAVAKELARLGHLTLSGDGKSTVRVRIPDLGQARVYLVRSSILGGES